MSDSVRPHRRQPTRLPRTWESPGKNAGVGCHSFSNAWKWKVKVKSLSRVWFSVTPWAAAYQAPPSMEFSRQECWSGLPLPSANYELTDMIPDRTVGRLYFLWWKMFHYVKCWGWDGWMTSPTQWTSIWVNTGSCWWTGRPGVLQSLGSQRVRHDWVTLLMLNGSPSRYWCSFQIPLMLIILGNTSSALRSFCFQILNTWENLEDCPWVTEITLVQIVWLPGAYFPFTSPGGFWPTTRQTPYINAYMWNLKKIGIDDFIYKAKIETEM